MAGKVLIVDDEKAIVEAFEEVFNCEEIGILCIICYGGLYAED